MFPPTPNPPVITRAPVVVELAFVPLVNNNAFDVTVLLLVILCRVATLQTTMSPVEVLTAVSVPAVKLVVPILLIVNVAVVPLEFKLVIDIAVPAVGITEVITLFPLSYICAARTDFTTDTPPSTITAPMLVEELSASIALEILKEFVTVKSAMVALVTFNSATLICPPTDKFLPIPTPPATTIAPLLTSFELVKLVEVRIALTIAVFTSISLI